MHAVRAPVLYVAFVILGGCNAILGFQDPHTDEGDGGAFDASTPDVKTHHGDEASLADKPQSDSADSAVDENVFSSCAALTANCGPMGDRSCCDTAEVPGGKFNRNNDQAFPATISRYRLDVYEVTVGRFRKFLASGAGTQKQPPPLDAGAHPKIAESGWKTEWNAYLTEDAAKLSSALQCETFQYFTWTDAEAGNERRPINCVTWYEAFAFCAWDGGRLATQTELNYTAAGGAEQFSFPWGTLLIDSSNASYYTSDNECEGDGQPGCAVTDLVFVGTKPLGNGKWGHADLTGNVSEWTLDYYQATPVLPCVDCAELTPSTRRVARGGSFLEDYRNSATTKTIRYLPDERLSKVGIRCARDR